VTLFPIFAAAWAVGAIAVALPGAKKYLLSIPSGKLLDGMIAEKKLKRVESRVALGLHPTADTADAVQDLRRCEFSTMELPEELLELREYLNGEQFAGEFILTGDEHAQVMTWLLKRAVGIKYFPTNIIQILEHGRARAQDPLIQSLIPPLAN
jgi:hypothetical protein